MNEAAHFDGLLLDLTQALDAAARAAQDAVHKWMLFDDGDFDISRFWERKAWKPDIYEVPVDVMVKARRISRIYGSHSIGGRAVWGRVGEIDVEAEKKAADERDAYRVAHRDAIDPIKAAIDEEAANLPQLDHDVPLVYFVTDYRQIRREFGIFTTYENALDAAHERATIRAMPADGKTSPLGGKLLRGYFDGGWGYASGYAPNDS